LSQCVVAVRCCGVCCNVALNVGVSGMLHCVVAVRCRSVLSQCVVAVRLCSALSRCVLQCRPNVSVSGVAFCAAIRHSVHRRRWYPFAGAHHEGHFHGRQRCHDGQVNIRRLVCLSLCIFWCVGVLGRIFSAVCDDGQVHICRCVCLCFLYFNVCLCAKPNSLLQTNSVVIGIIGLF